MTALAPPFPYYGGKQTIARDIVEQLPPHRHYVEPFAGSLAVLLAKPPSAHETVNDRDGDVVAFWRVLRDRPEELQRACALTPHSRAEHRAAQDPPTGDADDVERARRVWVELSQSRGSMRRRTGWRTYHDPGRTVTSMPGYLRGYVGRIAPAAERLARVSLECRPALDLIDRYGRHEDVAIYADPPYLGSTRAWGDQYRHEMRSESEHRELADALRGCRAAVVLSAYPSPLYDELYAGWRRVEVPTWSGQANDGARTEVLWCNRPAPATPLFDLEASA